MMVGDMAMPKARKRVLVVDDEADAREFVRSVVENLGFDTLEAIDGTQGLEVARASKPDLIVLDVQMPKRDGYAVFSELRKDGATKAIPVVMLTASGKRTGIKIDANDMGQYLGSEPEAYVDKPVDPTVLGDTIVRLLGD